MSEDTFRDQPIVPPDAHAETHDNEYDDDDDLAHRRRRQRDMHRVCRQDIEHLNLLAILHYVYGGITALFSLIPLLYVVAGFVIMFMPPSRSGPSPDEAVLMGTIFVVLGGLAFFIGEIMAIMTIISGRLLHNRRGYMFSLVVACLLCLSIPFGTALGVFTIIVLCRESVQKLYGRWRPPTSAAEIRPKDG